MQDVCEVRNDYNNLNTIFMSKFLYATSPPTITDFLPKVYIHNIGSM